jgi:CBS domain-containing protein
MYATTVRALLRRTERICVVAEDDRFLGIITRKDVMLVTSTKSNLKAKEIMSTPVLTVGPDEEVHAVGRKMVEKDVYSVPVLRAGAVVGIVHAEDVLQTVYRPTSKKVEDIMTTSVVSCDHEENAAKVWNLMEYHNFTGLPITRTVSTSHRRYKKLEGFITQKDILSSGEVRPGKGSRSYIEKAMTRTPKYVRPHDSVDTCVNLFKEYDIGRLPVVKDGFELVGIVDREDILNLYV